MGELSPCPFCGSTDVGAVSRLGTMHLSCYRCSAEVKFSEIGLHLDDQVFRYNSRPERLTPEEKDLIDAAVAQRKGALRQDITFNDVVDNYLQALEASRD